MPGTGIYKLDSLRPNRFPSEGLFIALAVSLLIHLLICAAYVLDQAYHIFQFMEAKKKLQQVQRVPQYADPIEFVTVPNPSTEAPAKPKFISNKNSVAADDSQNKAQENPQLNGKQTDIPQTLDLVRTKTAQELQPNTPAKPEPSASPGAAPAKPAVTPGDLTLGKPNDSTQQPEQQQPPRPRTIKEAMAQMASRMPSLTMKQEGGAQRHARVPSFDVKVTGFGDYDARFVEAVSQNWWNLLDSQRFSLDRTGKVVLYFRLNYDGSISEMRFVNNNVGDLLGYVCEKAVLDGAPYERWSQDMRLKLGDSTEVQFTFDYFSNL
jgi:hypothetical protein